MHLTLTWILPLPDLAAFTPWRAGMVLHGFLSSPLAQYLFILECLWGFSVHLPVASFTSDTHLFYLWLNLGKVFFYISFLFSSRTQLFESPTRVRFDEWCLWMTCKLFENCLPLKKKKTYASLEGDWKLRVSLRHCIDLSKINTKGDLRSVF